MKKQLLVVDDDEVLLMIIERMFIKVNPELKVRTFLEGKEALAYLAESDSETVPTIMVDIYLKDMNGWEFLEVLDQNEKFKSKVFLITSSVGSQNEITAQQYQSVAGFFEKPITFESIKAINQIICSVPKLT